MPDFCCIVPFELRDYPVAIADFGAGPADDQFGDHDILQVHFEWFGRGRQAADLSLARQLFRWPVLTSGWQDRRRRKIDA